MVLRYVVFFLSPSSQFLKAILLKIANVTKQKKDSLEEIMKLLIKCKNAGKDACFRIPTLLTTATINITFAAPTNKILLIITIVLNVTWQGKRQRNFKTLR
jgi:hypothetical protein